MTHRAVALAAITLIAACGSPKLIKAPCQRDSDCENGLLCEDYRCIEAKTKACEVVTDGNPILQPSPYTVAFGDLDTADAELTLELHSIGNCTLTLYEAGLTGTSSPFGCGAFCAGKFPIEIFPGRNVPVTVSFKAKAVGKADDELKILSDDREFPELRVPIHADFLGVPLLKAAPNPVDFGYLAMGRRATRKVTLSNQGTGVAPVEVRSIALDPVDSMDFALDVTALTLPSSLVPVAKDSSALLAFEVAYTPRSNAVHHASVVVTTAKGELRVPVKGNSETPPVIDVCAGASMAGSPRCLSNMGTPTVNLGTVPYGATNVLPVTILNKGGAPLKVTYKWGGSNHSTDLSASPAVLPEVMGGTYVDLQVAYTNTSGMGQATGILELTTNDPSHPSISIPVNATNGGKTGPEVVKIEMVFDNGTDGLFDKDVRNVDMHLEHPFGYVCDKAHPNPTTWGTYGNPSWLAFPPKEEPERIILADAMVDATYRVQVSYMEDCKSLPTELLAGLLGISVDVLVDYLSGGVVPIDGSAIGDLIANVCLDHSSSNVTITAYVNGAVIGNKTVTLGKKGDLSYALDLVRENGKFKVQ
ncbi:MAG: choice-of-anchor D domain-containing protein [Archangiaceae bacterium]|nr:choice-of-anchor D domain-containing protein [Archangiaceae bacterium]